MVGAKLRADLNLGYAQPPQTRDGVAAEQSASFAEFQGEQLYRVDAHANSAHRANALICGPFAAERERSYSTTTMWARTLVSRRIGTRRFDYRGMGESTGAFERMNFTNWVEDAAFCARDLNGAPLVLHGIRMGALIAAELFASGVGQALLLWAPPASASVMLSETMRRTIMSQRMADPHAPWRTREEQIAALEAGDLVNVDGYFWSRNLWDDAKKHSLLLPAAGERRPWRSIHIRNIPVKPDAAPGHQMTVRADQFWESSPLSVPHSEDLVNASLSWLESTVLGGAA